MSLAEKKEMVVIKKNGGWGGKIDVYITVESYKVGPLPVITGVITPIMSRSD